MDLLGETRLQPDQSIEQAQYLVEKSKRIVVLCDEEGQEIIRVLSQPDPIKKPLTQKPINYKILLGIGPKDKLFFQTPANREAFAAHFPGKEVHFIRKNGFDPDLRWDTYEIKPFETYSASTAPKPLIPPTI